MNPFWTEDAVLGALHDWADKHGRPPGWLDWRLAEYGHPSATTVVERFGSWNAALVAAGLPARRQGRPQGGPVQDEVLRAIRYPRRARDIYIVRVRDAYVRATLRVLVQQGRAVRVSRGVYVRAA